MNKTYRMLIIDDSREVLGTLRDYFEMKNFEVVAVPDSLEALRILEKPEGLFDILITDLIMPNMSGVGIIAIAKKKYPDIIVIAITGWGRYPEELAGEAKADAVIAKPIQLSELEDLVFQLLEKESL